jgi:hypothetical protein
MCEYCKKLVMECTHSDMSNDCILNLIGHREGSRAFTVACHECGEVLYEGIDLIPLETLTSKYKGNCPACNSQLSITPKTIERITVSNKSYSPRNWKNTGI